MSNFFNSRYEFYESLKGKFNLIFCLFFIRTQHLFRGKPFLLAYKTVTSLVWPRPVVVKLRPSLFPYWSGSPHSPRLTGEIRLENLLSTCVWCILICTHICLCLCMGLNNKCVVFFNFYKLTTSGGNKKKLFQHVVISSE